MVSGRSKSPCHSSQLHTIPHNATQEARHLLCTAAGCISMKCFLFVQQMPAVCPSCKLFAGVSPLLCIMLSRCWLEKMLSNVTRGRKGTGSEHALLHFVQPLMSGWSNLSCHSSHLLMRPHEKQRHHSRHDCWVHQHESFLTYASKHMQCALYRFSPHVHHARQLLAETDAA